MLTFLFFFQPDHFGNGLFWHFYFRMNGRKKKRFKPNSKLFALNWNTFLTRHWILPSTVFFNSFFYLFASTWCWHTWYSMKRPNWISKTEPAFDLRLIQRWIFDADIWNMIRLVFKQSRISISDEKKCGGKKKLIYIIESNSTSTEIVWRRKHEI